MSAAQRIEERLAALVAAGLYRDPEQAASEARAEPGVQHLLDARSNDYLGLGALVASDDARCQVEEYQFRGRARRSDVSRETSGTPAREAPTRELEGGERASPRHDYTQASAGASATAQQHVSRETLERPKLGAGASRLISGTSPEHLELEAELASWLGMEACLLFSSAYAANLGVLGALGLPGDVVFSDALNHASIIDGCRLGRAEVVVVPHRDLGALASALRDHPGQAKWVVSESYFGMDGTSPDFGRLRSLCDEYGAGLILDEAHSIGVFGEQGRGLAARHGVRPDVLVAGFGKAFGLQGGFAATSLVVHRWLWNRARSFVFSTASSPWLSRQTRRHLDGLRAAEEARRQLDRHGRTLEAILLRADVPLPPGRHGPIFPIVFGPEQTALAAARELRLGGVRAHAVRPPTVPRATARIRVTLRADMTDAEVGQLGSALVEVWKRHAVGAMPVANFPAPTGPSPGDSRGPVAENSRFRAQPSRWVILGTGTEVGKSFIADALVRAIAARGRAVAGLKPIETGYRMTPTGAPVEGDAARLEAASLHVKHPRPHPLYGFAEPLTPSLAARRSNRAIALETIRPWIESVRSTHGDEPPALVVETAGGVFSPLQDGSTNFDLALSLGLATWVLVAPDRLGVLHDSSSTLRAMHGLGRAPDWVVLSAPAQPDASTGTNAAELRRLGLAPRILEVFRNEPGFVQGLLDPPAES